MVIKRISVNPLLLFLIVSIMIPAYKCQLFISCQDCIADPLISQGGLNFSTVQIYGGNLPHLYRIYMNADTSSMTEKSCNELLITLLNEINVDKHPYDLP